MKNWKKWKSGCLPFIQKKGGLILQSDAVYKKTKRQIQKEYNDALERALKKNKEYFKTVEAVQSGKIKPPSGLHTDAQIEAWKRGYLRRYAQKSDAINSML